MDSETLKFTVNRKSEKNSKEYEYDIYITYYVQTSFNATV